MKTIPDNNDLSHGNQIHFMVMKYIKAVESLPGKNPVGVARLYFLLGSVMWNAYAVLDETFPFMDGFSVQRLKVSKKATEQEVFMVFQRLAQACFVALKRHCVPNLELIVLPDTIEQFPFITTDFTVALDAYLTERNRDGFFTTKPYTFPNQGKFIVIGGATPQNLNTDLNSVGTWAPLETRFPDGSIRRQNPLQPYFGEVRSWFTDSEKTDMFAIADKHYPSSTVFSDQVQTMKDSLQPLTEKEKLIAEIWMNSDPARVLPPGSWMVLLAITLAAGGYDLRQAVSLVGGIGFCLFHAGVAAWAVKYKYLQPRPVQTLRAQFFGGSLFYPITRTNGPAADWIPYQRNINYTPPFPDYVSGHSTFSMACACFLELATGSNSIPVQGCTVDPSYLQMLSQNFDVLERPVLLSNIVLPPKSCYVDTSLPLNPVELNWSTWTGLAREIGSSRVYGNIHWANSNLGGMALGEWVASRVLEKINWKQLNVRF